MLARAAIAGRRAAAAAAASASRPAAAVAAGSSAPSAAMLTRHTLGAAVRFYAKGKEYVVPKEAIEQFRETGYAMLPNFLTEEVRRNVAACVVALPVRAPRAHPWLRCGQTHRHRHAGNNPPVHRLIQRV
jgi:hypothetical protein